MRDFKNMKRQRGRNRGGGGGKPQQNANRAFDSNGPDNVKIRGHAQHVFEKYQQLARDAFSSGDRVLAENYLQHADHYFRVLRTIQPQRPPSEILGRDVLASGLDIDFEEEFEAAEETAEAAPADGEQSGGDQRVDGQRFEGRREDRWERDTRREGYENRDQRDGRNDRFERRDGETYARQDHRDRVEGRDRPENRDRFDNRDRTENRERGDNRDRGENRDRPENRDRGDSRDRTENRDRPEYRERSENRERGDGRERFEGRRDRDGRRFEGRRDGFNRDRDTREPRFEERASADAEAHDPLAVVAPEAAAPFPTPMVEADSSPVLRSEDGGMSEAPAFLQAAPMEEERKPRPRRRRAPKSFEASDGEAPAAPVAEEA